MDFSKVFLVAFVFLQCIQFEIDQANADTNIASLSASKANLRKVKKTKEHQRFGIFQEKHGQVRCPGHLKKCRTKKNIKTKLPFKNRKKDKRCCNRRNKKCLRKLRRRCKTTKCTIRQGRKCRKQFSKCNKRKSTNRRPGNCGPTRIPREGKNHRPRPKIPRPTTTTKPEVKKREKEECSRSSECAEGLCCARHQHVRICKPLIQKNQVCTREYKHNKRSPAMYERCPCAEGLTCAASKFEIRHHTCQIKT